MSNDTPPTWDDLENPEEDNLDPPTTEDGEWDPSEDPSEDPTEDPTEDDDDTPAVEEDFSHIKSVKEANKEIKNETDKQTRLQATLDTARSNLNALNSLAATQADLDIHQQELSDEQDHLKKLQEIHSRNRLWKRALIGVVTLGFYGKKQRDKDRDYLSG